MKGLERIPANRDLLKAYEKLQGRREFDVGKLSLWSQWARFDPRLAEQLVEYLARNWRELAPFAVHQALARQPWPAAFGVLLEQILTFVRFENAPEKKQFAHWRDCVMEGFAPAPGEQFFVGLRSFAGKIMQDDAALALQPYRRWGYLGREVLLNKASSEGMTLIPAKNRRAVLDELLAKRARITVRDYRASLGGWVSLRQAERDLESHPRARAMGRTKGRSYR